MEQKKKILGAVLAIRSLPIELFGVGDAARTRRSVFLQLATYADPDGMVYVGQARIAKECGFSRPVANDVFQWLRNHDLMLKSQAKSNLNTNIYKLCFDAEAQARCRKSIQNDPEITGRAAKVAVANESRRKKIKASWETGSHKIRSKKTKPSPESVSLNHEVCKSALCEVCKSTLCVCKSTLSVCKSKTNITVLTVLTEKEKPVTKEQDQNSHSETSGQGDRVHEFELWLARTYSDLSLTYKQKTRIREAITGRPFSLAAFKTGAGDILNTLDCANSFDHAGDRLAENLAIRAEAAHLHTAEMVKQDAELQLLAERARQNTELELQELDREAIEATL